MQLMPSLSQAEPENRIIFFHQIISTLTNGVLPWPDLGEALAV
jgi:hypothetical protein